MRKRSPRSRVSRRRTAFPWPRPRPARAAWRGTTRSTSARSASPGRPPRTTARARPRGPPGPPAANDCAREADLVLAVGTRLQDFTTGSHTLFAQARLLSVNVQPFDAHKWHGDALGCDARDRESG